MKLYKLKAIIYPLVGIGHIVFWRHFPNPVLASVIAVGCLGLGVRFICRWIEEA